LQVGGNWIVYLYGSSSNYNRECYLSAGRVELSGDFRQIAGSYLNFHSFGTHVMAFVGAGPHNVSVASSDAKIAHLEMDEDAEITWKSYLNVGTLENDGEIISDGAIISGLHLNGHTLKIEGDLQVVGGINGYQGVLEITGDVWHTNGSIALNKGTLKIDGDYRMHNTAVNSAGEEYLTSSDGTLNMNYEEDLLQVGGNWIVYLYGSSSNYNRECYLSAGRVELSGDFRQIAGSYLNFHSSGTHVTVLNGTGDPQYITFADSRFNILQLTRSGEWYVFSPDNCWNSLWTEPDTTIPVTNISLSDRSRKLQVGEVYTIAVLVTPANATDPTLTWTSSDPTVASVTQDGTVTALAEGTAVIRAQAGNVYRTCTVTVSEVYTGEIEIGSVIAGPGETVHIPVMAWDNPGFAAMKIHIGYDPALLTLLDVAAGEALDVGTLDFEPVEDGCNILWYNGQDAAENGVLFHLAMQVAENAAVDRAIALTPTIEKGDVCKENHQAVLFTLTSGAVQVSSIEKGDIYEDGTLNVHDILLLQHYLTDLETLSDRQLYAADLNGDGSVNMKDIVLLAQQLLQRVILLDDGGLQPMTFALGEGTFDGEGYVEIPLLVSGETPLAAMRMEILYDHTLAELVEIEAAELLEENFCHNLSDAARTRDLITWYKASDVEMEGSIMTLRFRLLDDRYDGLIPVVLRTAEGDICNARLESPEVEKLHGVLRTEGYDLHAWVSGLDAAVNEDGSAELTGILVCTQDMQDTEAVVTFAAYTADGRMTNIWTETIELQNGERLCAEGDLYGGTEVQVFLTTADSYMPLSCTSVCTAE